MNEIARTLHMPLPEFINIVSKNRPLGISDEDWERYVSSVTMEFFKFGNHDEQEKEMLMKNLKFAMSAPNSPSLSSIDAVLGMSSKECTPSLSEIGTVSSAQFAGRFVLPDSSDHESSAGSTSVWSLNSESTSLSKKNWASVRCLKQVSDADEDRVDSDMVLNSRCTTLCLKDFPSNSYEENLFYNENKMSTPTRSPVAGDGIIGSNKICSPEKDVFDEIKVNLRIAQF
jgi:hypothetical protein